jgi:hypothetical protein
MYAQGRRKQNNKKRPQAHICLREGAIDCMGEGHHRRWWFSLRGGHSSLLSVVHPPCCHSVVMGAHHRRQLPVLVFPPPGCWWLLSSLRLLSLRAPPGRWWSLLGTNDSLSSLVSSLAVVVSLLVGGGSLSPGAAGPVVVTIGTSQVLSICYCRPQSPPSWCSPHCCRASLLYMGPALSALVFTPFQLVFLSPLLSLLVM